MYEGLVIIYLKYTMNSLKPTLEMFSSIQCMADLNSTMESTAAYTNILMNLLE